MNLIAVAKYPARLSGVLNFLERRGIGTRVVDSLNEAAEVISKNEAQILLISIDFKDQRIENFISTLDHKTSLLMLVFGEEPDGGAIAALKHVRARHVFLESPTGVKILARITSFQKSSSSTGHTHVLKGTRGAAPEIEIQSSGKTIPNSFHDQGQGSNVHSVVQQGPAPLRNGRPVPLFANKQQIEKAVQQTLEFVCPSQSSDSSEMGAIVECELFCIDTFAFKGTFIAAYSERRGFSGSPLQAIQEHLVRNLAQAGLTVKASDIQVLPMKGFELPFKLMEDAEHLMIHRCRQFDVGLAYFSSVSIIPVIAPRNEAMHDVELRHFIPDSQLRFDAYIRLTGTNRLLKYWRADDTVDSVRLQRIMQKGAQILCVRTEDMKKFTRYAAYNAVVAEVDRLKVTPLSASA